MTGKSRTAGLHQTHPDETLHLKYDSSTNKKAYAAKRYIVINRLPNGKQEVYEYTFEEPIVPEPRPRGYGET